MKILVAHNSYQQHGGEDAVFASECALLEKAGHQVQRFSVSNDQIVGLRAKVTAAISILRNKASVAAFNKALASFHPDVVHIHNSFPTLSPAVLLSAVAQGYPVIQTFHNYRPLCMGAMLLRGGLICEDCVGRGRWRGIGHRCYRGSMMGSACVSLLGPYLKKLALRYPRHMTFVALTHFAKSRYVADGFPEESIVVRGNCLADPGVGGIIREPRFVYVGRLSQEKGVDTIIEAANARGFALDIIGSGPDQARLEKLNGNQRTRFLGALASEGVLAHIKTATALLVPSRWYEGFPMVVLESMATATPVIASQIGSLAEIIRHEETGLLVRPQDRDGWIMAIGGLLEDPTRAAAMGRAARMLYEAEFSEPAGLRSLLAIYEAARLRASMG